jgi:hypothetical protein
MALEVTFAQRLHGLRTRCGRLVWMRIGPSSAAAVAAASFALTAVVCEELVGLGTGPSLAAASLLVIIVAPWMVFMAARRPDSPGPRRVERPYVPDVGSDQGEPDEPLRLDQKPQPGRAERADRSDWQMHDEPGVLETSPRHLRKAAGPPRAQTLVTTHIKVIVDDAGLEVRTRRRAAGADIWETHLRIQWSAVTAIQFATDSYDPIVALYVYTAAGRRHHVADSGFLSQSEWTRFGKLISESSRGRLTLNLAGRRHPRSTSPDW